METSTEKVHSAILDALINLMNSDEIREAYKNADDEKRTEFSQAIWNMMKNSASVQLTA